MYFVSFTQHLCLSIVFLMYWISIMIAAAILETLHQNYRGAAPMTSQTIQQLLNQ